MIKHAQKLKVSALIVLMMGTAAMAQVTTLLDDFSEKSATRWGYVADTVMGGVSDGTAQIRQDGDRRFVKLQGTVSTDNNGGFIQVRRNIDALPDGTVGMTVTARGNGETYYVFLRSRNATRPWHSYRATFVAGDDWSETSLNLADFEPSRSELPPKILPEDIVGMGLVAYGKDFEADLEVAEIGLY